MSTDTAPGPAPETPDPSRRRGRLRLAAGLTGGAALLAGALFWVSGGWDAWRHDGALDSACDGTLAAGPVRELVGGAEVTADIRRDRIGSWWQCRVTEVDADDADDADDGAGRIDLRVTVSEAGDRLFDIDASRTDAPLGHGWTGGFAFDPDRENADQGDATATLLLDCRGKRGGGLTAEVRARTDRLDFGRPEARARLTAVLTGTATAYARQTGCEAVEGGPVTEVGVSATAWDHEPFGTVSGSCAGIVDAATAGRWGVRTAVETAPGPKPVEGCVLGGLRGAPLYEFTASYGAGLDWATRERLEDRTDDRKGDAPDGGYLLWAACPGGTKRAAYTVSPPGRAYETSELALDHPGLRAALQRFAARSAQAHGCGLPGTGRVYDAG
ncbi:hypothetical protein [Streptomyces sp. NPDC046385]|uniref:hypothetical protein n=1 Tax=Streptomyces sp. NPDC046385 TaxID=3154918 RepID=UPI0033DE3EA2